MGRFSVTGAVVELFVSQRSIGMGLDIYGQNPRTEAGSYCMINWTGWNGIPDFIFENHPHLVAKCSNWNTNDGDGFGDADAEDLGTRLLADIESRAADECAKHYRLNVDVVHKFAVFCRDLGGFEIW